VCPGLVFLLLDVLVNDVTKFQNVYHFDGLGVLEQEHGSNDGVEGDWRCVLLLLKQRSSQFLRSCLLVFVIQVLIPVLEQVVMDGDRLRYFT